MINNTAVTKQEDMNNEKKYTVWEKYKFGEEISLEGILEIIELSPRWVKYLEDANFSDIEKCFFKEEACYRFKESLLSSLKFTQMDDRLLHRFSFKDEIIRRNGIKIEESVQPIMHLIMFDKWELINWMEKEAEADPDFMYMLPQDFVEFCRKKQAMPSYSELLEENRELKQKNETLEKEIKKLQKQDVGVRDRSKIKIFIVKLASQIKKDMAKNHIAIDGVIVQAILMFLDLEADAYGTVIDSDGKEVKGLSVSFLRKALIEENLMSTNNKVGKKSKEMREKEEAILRMIADLFEEAQYRKLYRESEEIQKMLKCKK